MREETYFKICDLCDEILGEGDDNVEKHSIPYLHVQSEHPVSLKKYKNIFNCNKYYSSALLVFLSRAFYQLLTSFFVRPGVYFSKASPNKVDAVFISHYLNESQKTHHEDFYFGAVPEEIKKMGHDCVVLLHDQIGTSNLSTMKNWSKDLEPRVMFPRTLKFKNELKILTDALRQSCLFFKKTFLENDREMKCGLKSIAINSLSMSSISSLRLFYQYKDFFEKYNPEVITVTYEGHAWERVAFAAARSVNQNVRCIGYQHAILFPRQHSIKKKRGKKYDPDVILTSGCIAEEILKDEPELEGVRIINVGTHKKKNGSYLVPKNKENLYKKNSVLVIPDGIISECIIILGFVVDAAMMNPTVNFVFRLHPILSFGDLIKENKSFSKIPDNIEISLLSIDEDFARCQWALYRGTSAIIHAVSEGLRPLYLSLSGELDIDPLYRLNEWKKKVVIPSELLSIVDKDINDDCFLESDSRESAKVYCNKYFTPINTKKFINALLY